jgi:16S rRNA (uracil1498-N3)-methyltransferase
LVLFSFDVMIRVLIDTVRADRAYFSEDEQHHLLRVRRARVGDEFEAIDGKGSRFHCLLERDAQGWFGRITTRLDDSRESPIQISLAQALIKKDNFEWVIQKAVELGVAEVIPMLTDHTEVQLAEHRQQRKMARWSRILSEAVKQCGRSRLPRLSSPLTLGDVLENKREMVAIALDESEGASLRDFLRGNRGLTSCLILIGPEGGWSQEDRRLLSEHGVIPIHLGTRVLRAETASIAALSIVQYELGDLCG